MITIIIGHDKGASRTGTGASSGRTRTSPPLVDEAMIAELRKAIDTLEAQALTVQRNDDA